MVCFGNNQYGQTTVPVQMRRAHTVDALSHTCAISRINEINSVGCWGVNITNQTNVPAIIYGGDWIGDEDNNMNKFRENDSDNDDDNEIIINSSSGSIDNNKVEIKQVMTGKSHTCAISMDDKLQCWGERSFMQGMQVAPIGDVTGLKTMVTNEVTCLMKHDQTIKCYGKLY